MTALTQNSWRRPLTLLVLAFACASTSGAVTERAPLIGCGASTHFDGLANEPMHGGGLNACGCHFNRKTGECHCHRPRACGCECEPESCKKKKPE